mgnify:CR=1 FL=1
MKLVLLILGLSLCSAVVFYALGSFIGNQIAKKQKKRDEMIKNGNKHV